MTPLRFRHWLLLGTMLGALGSAQAGAEAATTEGPYPPATSGAARAASDESVKSLKFETYQDKKKEHRWRLKSSNGQIIASSGQGYKDKRDCEHAIDVIKKGAETAKVEAAAE